MGKLQYKLINKMISNQTAGLMILAALILAVLILAVISRRGNTRRIKKSYGSFEKEFVSKKWVEIQETIKKDTPTALKQAVIDTDKLLDYVLKGLGFKGETMGERLKKARSSFSDNNGIWYAHKLRNRMVHESEYEVQVFEIRDALGHFKQALKDLKVI